jgi:hypothetical protein
VCGRRDERFGLGQKPKFVTNRKKGFRVRAGSGQFVFKPNAKRGNCVGSSKGLGPVAGFSDTGLGPSTGSDLGRSYPNPFVSPKAVASAVKDGVFWYEGYDPTRSKMPDVADGYVQASPRSSSPVGMVTMYSSAEISQNTPKPM